MIIKGDFMNVLILGGTGFLSAAFLNELIKLNKYNIDTITRTGVNLIGVRNNFILDRNSVALMNHLLTERAYEYVFDFSSYSNNDVSIVIKSIDLDALKLYVYFSSISVYSDDSPLLSENNICDATLFGGQYGINKLRNERYIIDVHQKNNFSYMIIRPPYIYGKTNNIHRENYYIQRALNNQRIFLPYNDIKFQMINLTDILTLLVEILDLPNSYNQIFNYSYKKSISLHQVVNLIMTITNSKSELYFFNEEKTYCNVSSLRIIPYHNQSFYVSIDKAKKFGLHEPEVDFVTGISELCCHVQKYGIQTKQPLLDSVDVFFEKGYFKFI